MDNGIDEMTIEDHEFESHEDETDKEQGPEIEFNTDDIHSPSGELIMDKSADTMQN